MTRPPNRRAAGSMTSCAWQIQDQITCLLAEACVRACRRADLDSRYRGRTVKQRPYLSNQPYCTSSVAFFRTERWIHVATIG